MRMVKTWGIWPKASGSSGGGGSKASMVVGVFMGPDGKPIRRPRKTKKE